MLDQLRLISDKSLSFFVSKMLHVLNPTQFYNSGQTTTLFDFQISIPYDTFVLQNNKIVRKYCIVLTIHACI